MESSTAVFILYYSDGYFKSTNCRSEIHTAIEMSKPINLIFPSDRSMLDVIKEECSQYCDKDKVDSILSRLLGDDSDSVSINGPIQWLDEGSFHAAAFGRIYNRILLYLPYYIKNMNELEQGIKWHRVQWVL